MSTNSGSSSLRPAWKGGRGFQPPPTVTSDARGRSSSTSEQPPSKRDSNKFSALDEDEDDFVPVGAGKRNNRNRNDSDDDNNNNNNNKNNKNSNDGPPKPNSRSEGLRSGFGGTGGGGGGKSKPGRSLADLASRAPEGTMTRSASTGYSNAASAASAGRFSGLGGSGGGRGGTGDPVADAANVRPPRNELSEYKKAVEAAKAVRYTREKLLSIRPRPSPDSSLPEQLKNADVALLLSDAPQDPVCWDSFDADEIWATVPPRRTSAPGLTKGPPPEAAGERRRTYNVPNRARWERGVALPPPGEGGKRGSAKEVDANSPNDLWDDPMGGGAAGAAMDFSAFGAMPEADLNDGGGDAFDFDKMAEASREFEKELHGSKGSEDLGDDEDQHRHMVKVDPKRPLASAGTTIRSGSGDNVNVFEDFDEPGEGDDEAGKAKPTKAGSEDPDATSRLMAMIGVTKEDEILTTKSDSASVGDEPKNSGVGGLLGLGGGGSISLNPWGGPIIPGGGSQPAQQSGGLGMNLASRLESFAAEQKAREAAELEQKELLRRRQDQEEAQRLALAQQQQAQERARQQAMQQSPQNQVELVLMERISAILENSWGRSDLMSILSTLHAEDSRVIPLLSNVDLLRDLIAHNPNRVQLRHDPAFGAEMAVLVTTNAQWQQQQQQQAQARARQEELRRREEQIRMENLQRQRSMSDNPPRVNPDAPWFYSDPQNNVQGPFRSDEMRQWLEAGYFKGDLPISQQANGPFIPLSAIFPDLAVAFKTRQDDPVQEKAAARARAEEERRRAAELEKQRQAELEAREAAERQRREMEAAVAAANSNGDSQNQSSAQLKMMLGLPQQQQRQQQESQRQRGAGSEALPTREKPKQTEKQVQKSSLKNDKSNNIQSNMQKPFREQPQEQAPVPAPPAAPAWGGAAQSAPATRKSMSEIQKEEARRAAALAAQHGNQGRQSGSGWANVAAAGKSSWTPGTVKASPAAVVSGSAAAVVSGSSRVLSQFPGGRATKPALSATGEQRQSGAQQQRSSSTNSTAEEFGASMSPQLENWCKEQMQKLNGTDDLTLVAFCMTLNDPVEIRQYLTTYLGSTPQVNKFANEFISKKSGGASQQEEWETPGSAKKGSKKKKAR